MEVIVIDLKLTWLKIPSDSKQTVYKTIDISVQKHCFIYKFWCYDLIQPTSR